MQGLVEAAQRVIDTWESGDLAGAVRALQDAIPETASDAQHAQAVSIASTDSHADMEIDDVAYIARSEGGVWVSAWVWVED